MRPRVGAVGAKFGANFVRLGFGARIAISAPVAARVASRARASFLAGTLVDGATAAQLGILDRAVAAEDVLAER